MKYLILTATLLLFIVMGCREPVQVGLTDPQEDVESRFIPPPGPDEPKPFLKFNGEIDTFFKDDNAAYLPGCDTDDGWNIYQNYTVEDADRSYSIHENPDDSMYRITYADKPSEEFRGQLYAVWDYINGYYYSPIDSGHVTCQDTFVFPVGMSDHYVNCTFSGFPGFPDCP